MNLVRFEAIVLALTVAFVAGCAFAAQLRPRRTWRQWRSDRRDLRNINRRRYVR